MRMLHFKYMEKMVASSFSTFSEVAIVEERIEIQVK